MRNVGQANSAVRGCNPWSWWNSSFTSTPGACYNWCSQNSANACEWSQNGDCYVEFGAGCYVQGGFPGWWAAVLGTTPPPNQEEISLPVILRSQDTSMWCWAASGQMGMAFLGTFVAQCTQANDRFGRTDCCNIALCPTPATNHACVQGGWPEFGRYGFSFNTREAALSWDELRGQMATARSAVAFSWQWVGGGGHMMVARGIRVLADGSRMVEVNDPWAPCQGDHSFVTYDAYVSIPGQYTHWRDYFNIAR